MNSSGKINFASTKMENLHLPQTPELEFRARINRPYDMNAFLDEVSRRLEDLEMPRSTRPPLGRAQAKRTQHKMLVLNKNWEEAANPITSSRFIKAEAISHEMAKERLSMPKEKGDLSKVDIKNNSEIEVHSANSACQGLRQRTKKASTRLPLSRTFLEHKRQRSEEFQNGRRILGETSGNARVRGVERVSEGFLMTP